MIDPVARQALEKEYAVIRSLWEPPSDLTVSQWAQANRFMPKGATSRPGDWRADAFQVGIMDEFNNPETREIVVMKCTQIGWTEILNNIVGFIIVNDPQPVMMVRPTADDARNYGRQRFTAMLQNCPALRERVREVKEKRGGNTLLMKLFAGGFFKLVGANAGSGLRSEALRVILGDEVDGYPDDVDKEGDPIEIMKRRLDTYEDYKLLLGSTPAKPKGISRIEREFLRSDQRYFHVPCPHCGFMQRLVWRDPKTKEYRLRFDRLKDGRVDPASVRYVCAGCTKGIDERYRKQMIDAGRWVATFPGLRIAGFHINALYAPWKQDLWKDLAQEWIDAQDNQELLRAFVNLRLGETFEEQGETVAADVLAQRREKYACEVPAGVGALTLTIDVQDNRLECLITGFGAGEESWIIKHEAFWGDPGFSGPGSVWEQLEAFRLTQLTCAGGRKVVIDVTLIDSGGHHTDTVYDYVQPRQNSRDRVFALKGVDYHTKPVLVQENATKKKAIRLFTVATYPAKDRIYSRLKLPAPEPGSAAPAGFIHLPDWTTDEFLAQITGEKKLGIIDRRTRTKKYIWRKTHSSNEALDLTVYALAALHVLQGSLHKCRDLSAAAAILASPPDGNPPPTSTPSRGNTGGNWVTGTGRRGGGWMGGA